jgi:DNA-binding transcriptional MerR regulator
VDADLDIQDLCAVADVTPRTVYFYIQQGLLQSPDGTGRGAKYGPRHVVRLRLIKRLQKEHLPLAEIRRRLDALSDKDAELLLATPRKAAASPKASALDYVRSVLQGGHAPLSHRSPTAESQAHSDATPGDTGRATWERVALDPDIELHIRRPLSRQRNRQVEKLLAAARDILKGNDE